MRQVVKKEGLLEKFTRGMLGIGKSKRFVQILSSGAISWANKQGQTGHSEAIVGVRDHASALQAFKLSNEENKRFFCVLTTGKSLYLLCPTVEDCEAWVACIKSVIAKKM